MRRPPRSSRSRLFGRPTADVSLVQGMVALAGLAVLYGVVLRGGQGELEARTLAFTALIFANLGLILANCSWSRPLVAMLRVRNPALWSAVGGALAFLALVLWLPAIRALFRLSAVHPDSMAICMLAGLVPVLLFEVFKRTLVFRRRSALAR